MLCDNCKNKLPYQDSEMPVTEEWLRSIGFNDWDDALGIFSNGHVLDIEVDGSCMIYENAATEDEHTASLPGMYKTRGAVRLLCRAMGIKMKGDLP